MRGLGKTWTWAERCPAETSIYPARTKEQGNPKSLVQPRLQWAIDKGAPILTSRQLR